MRKEDDLVVLRAVQNMEDIDLILADTLEDQVVSVRVATNTACLISRHERKRLRHFLKSAAPIDQLFDETDGALGIVVGDVVTDTREIGNGLLRENDDHGSLF